jgi:hypothetical protein
MHEIGNQLHFSNWRMEAFLFNNSSINSSPIHYWSFEDISYHLCWIIVWNWMVCVYLFSE